VAMAYEIMAFIFISISNHGHAVIISWSVGGRWSVRCVVGISAPPLDRRLDGRTKAKNHSKRTPVFPQCRALSVVNLAGRHPQ
jgi:hypothetical protein